MRVSAVYFYFGETLIDRTREYAAIARELGTTPHTFSAVFGAVIAAGGDVNDALAHFGISRSAAHALASVPPLAEVDVYPDVRAALTQLRGAGLKVGIVGNQPAGVSAELRALELPADTIATSADWGTAKPAPAFFARIIADADSPADEIVYVGDQLDNDVVPALDAGLQAIRILRGPWGALIRDSAAESRCLAVVESLTEVADRLVSLPGGAGQ